MKRFIVGLLFTVLPGQSLFAQKAPVRFGDVPLIDLKMTRYDKDSSASAVILADYGISTLQYASDDFILTFERTTRIKILTKDGLDWADFEITLYHEGSNAEKISGVKGVTYNLENGKIVESKLKSDAVFREKYDANYDVVKASLPNVKEGSVIEFTYKVTSDFFVNFQDWDFQSTIPVRWSEYRAVIPEFFHYEKYMQGYVILDVNESTTSNNSITFTSVSRSGNYATKSNFNYDKIDFTDLRYRWAAKDVPAFKEEPYITTYRDYVSKINFELDYVKFPNQAVQPVMGSWDEICQKFAENPDFGGEISGNAFLKKTVQELTANLTTPEEKVGAIHQYVRNNILWDKSSRKYPVSSLKKVLEEKKGNNAEINLMMASMLEKAGFEVSAVLISTRDHGFVRQTTPVVSQFNYTICLVKIGENNVLLDATDKFLPTGVLPARCINGEGLVISKTGARWIALAAPGKSKTYTSTHLKLASDGTLTGKLQRDYVGYPAQTNRKVYFTKGEEDYIKDLRSKHNAEITKSEFKNTLELSEPFGETHELILNDHTTVAGDMIYINPLFGWKMADNPFKLEKREYPVDFGSPFDDTYLVRIILPDDYKLEEIPQSKIIALPNGGGKYTYNVSQAGNILSVTSALQINRNIFIQDEYPPLREFYNLIIAKQAEQIVLKKK